MLNPFTESVANAEVLTVDVTNSSLRSVVKSVCNLYNSCCSIKKLKYEIEVILVL